jgi:starch-binding outer membrane protein, SusD/RagB family
MKRNTYYRSIYLIFALLLLVSCEDFLDREPLSDRLETNFYQTEADAMQALVSAYDPLGWGAMEGNHPFETISDILSDDAYAGGANANDVPFLVKMDFFEADPNTNELRGLWNRCYFGIYRCNLLLEKIDEIEFETEGLHDRIISEVKFLRAYYYFDLIRLFGNVPLILRTIKPSENNQPQASPEQVFNQIATDLTEAIDALPGEVSDEEKGRVTVYAAKALLVKAYIYYSGYYAGKPDITTDAGVTIDLAKAIEMADDIVDSKIYELEPNFEDLFKVSNENNIESVFEIQYGDYQGGDWNWRIGTEGNQAVILYGIRDVSDNSIYAPGWSFAPFSQELIDAYENGDTRLAATVIFADSLDAEGVTYVEGFQHTGYYNKKFTALKEYNATQGDRELLYPNNYPAIRYADVLLMGAELHLRNNETGKAQEYYDDVRLRAFGDTHTPPVLTAGQAGIDLIMKERRLELAGEGHRYWDVLRQGMTVAEQELTDISLSYPFRIEFNAETGGLLPIPQQEIQLSNFTLTQNNGYN